MNSQFHIVCYITGHGFGHATRCFAILEQLLLIGHQVTIVTIKPLFLFEEFHTKFPNLFQSRISNILDPGVIQSNAVTIDEPKTWIAQIDFLDKVQPMIELEVEWLKTIKPNLAYIDIPPLAALACHLANIYTIAITNFSFDKILLDLKTSKANMKIVEYFTECYQKCNGILRLPGYIELPAFDQLPILKHIEDIKSNSPFCFQLPLVVRRARQDRQTTRRQLNISDEVKLLLINFGGFKLKTYLECNAIDSLLPAGWKAITVDTPPIKSDRFIQIEAQNTYMPDVILACDAVLGKCGYGVCSESVGHGIPLVYVSRPQFSEERGLIRMMGKLAYEMSIEDFETGRWRGFQFKFKLPSKTTIPLLTLNSMSNRKNNKKSHKKSPKAIHSSPNNKHTNSHLYAGPTFQNSPAPSSLPLPVFGSFKSDLGSHSPGHTKESLNGSKTPLQNHTVLQNEDIFQMDDDLHDDHAPVHNDSSKVIRSQPHHLNPPFHPSMNYNIQFYNQHQSPTPVRFAPLHPDLNPPSMYYASNIQPQLLQFQKPIETNHFHRHSDPIYSDQHELDRMSQNLKNILGMGFP
ncbi:hypothetical protein BC833DRAFT_623845 [Globomyces pollinis-pini]|nr:hypothetical protein BC833DRAFT_623845 [Globomyces pollinis-pini]